MTQTREFDTCIVGMGYVGLTLATALADAGVRVVGMEKNPTTRFQLLSGHPQIHESGLDEVYGRVFKSGMLTIEPADNLPIATNYIITVGTPVRNGQVQLDDLKSALQAVSLAMPEGALVVLRSTVLVGTTEGLALETLRGSNKNFHLAMAPERTLEGSALKELTTLPQIIGAIDYGSREMASKLFSKLGVEVVQLDSPAAAELAKLASNTYRDIKFAFANEIAYIADFFGVNAFNLIEACNYEYPRMNLAKPGPVAGPCLEKDAYILANSLTQFGKIPELTLAGRKTNEALPMHLVNVLDSLSGIDEPTNIGILGTAFKGHPETADVRGSMAQNIATILKNRFVESTILGWDPVVEIEDTKSLGITPVELDELLETCDVIIIHTNHKYFASQEFLTLVSEKKQGHALVYDLWNQIDFQSLPELSKAIIGLGNLATRKE